MMFRYLAREPLDWERIFIAQVDERVAPLGSQEQNLTQLKENLCRAVSLPQEQLLVMPVNDTDLPKAADRYATQLRQLAGDPPVLDLVHLGLGTDGHTASLVPGDSVLAIQDRDVAITGAYRGRPRMTLTYPLLNRSRRILWLVTGQEKAEVLRRLMDGDSSFPAGQVVQDRAIVFGDRAAVPSSLP